MIQWKKWKLLDHRKPNRCTELRFDEVSKLLIEKKIGPSDFLCSPKSDEFLPFEEIEELRYQYEKLILDDDYLFAPSKYIEKVSGLPVNPRTAFVQENYFFSDFFKKEKLSLIKRISKDLSPLLGKEEIIHYILSAKEPISFHHLFDCIFPSDHFFEMIVIITTNKVYQISPNPNPKENSLIDYIEISDIQKFTFQKVNSKQQNLKFSSYGKTLMEWNNIKTIDQIEISSFMKGKLLPNTPQTLPQRTTSQTQSSNLSSIENEEERKAFYLSIFLPGLGLMAGGFKRTGFLWCIAETLFIYIIARGLMGRFQGSLQDGLLFVFSSLLCLGIHSFFASDVHQAVKKNLEKKHRTAFEGTNQTKNELEGLLRTH